VKIILLVEGETEKKALPSFFQRWLKGKIDPLPAILPINAKGCDNHIKECALKASLYLKSPDVLAVIGLLDLYGPQNYPGHCTTPPQKCAWLRERLEKEINAPNFKQHFAIHELEAWLLSDPDIFPPEVKRALPGKAAHPETVNSTEPPAKLLTRLYREKTKRDYKKTTHGVELFSRLDPNIAYAKCPALAALLDDVLAFAQSACA
jgi:hypothetical protein